jgi:hypothetical protein
MARKTIGIRHPRFIIERKSGSFAALPGYCTADAMPDLILQDNQRWRRQRLRRLRSLDATNDEVSHVDLSVSVVRIAFAIPAEQCRAGPGNLEEGLNHSSFLQIVH